MSVCESFSKDLEKKGEERDSPKCGLVDFWLPGRYSAGQVIFVLIIRH